MKERCANVIENKGPAFSSPGPSGNFIEKTGSYAHSAGMLLEIKDVDGRWGKSRPQESGFGSGQFVVKAAEPVSILSGRRHLAR